MVQPIIEFLDFSFQYFAQAEPTLKHINLAIYPGEKILIVGPSGCGKSTLANCINGLIPFSYKGKMGGKLLIDGKPSTEQSLFEISKVVGTVLQDSDSQFIGMSVAEDLAFSPENDCTPRPELHRLVREIAHTVEIENHLQHAPGELSGGQKQRVAIGGVLMDDVKLLLFDEPLANLDPATGKNAVELIDQLQKDIQAATVLIEHRLEDALHRPVDRIVLMSEGQIIFDGKPDTLLAQNLLKQNGIREPLYITALKYAGIQIRPEHKPSHIDTLTLSEAEKARVQAWFKTMPTPLKTEEKAVVLEVENIDFTYANDFHALRGISAKVHAGELLAICGRNGAGKSTFSKVICGFEKQQAGSLTFHHQGKTENLMNLSIKERADRIGFVLQSPNQMISQTMIKDEVALGLRARHMAKEVVQKKTEEALQICGLYPFRNWPVSALSFGQKKRLTIASILVLDPEILILDEPTAGQDFRHYTEIMEFLLILSKRGLAIILITHDMHLMQEYAERAIVFNQGKIIADANPATVLTNQEIIEQANLKETSLFELAGKCDIPNKKDFVFRFMEYEREQRTFVAEQSEEQNLSDSSAKDYRPDLIKSNQAEDKDD